MANYLGKQSIKYLFNILCAPVAPIGTLAPGSTNKFRIKNYYNRDGDGNLVGNQSVRIASGTDDFGPEKIAKCSKLKRIDCRESIRIGNSMEIGGSLGIGKTQTRKLLWFKSDSVSVRGRAERHDKRSGSSKTNLNKIAADEEVDMDKRIEKLAMETAQYNNLDLEDVPQTPLAAETTISSLRNERAEEEPRNRMWARVRKSRSPAPEERTKSIANIINGDHNFFRDLVRKSSKIAGRRFGRKSLRKKPWVSFRSKQVSPERLLPEPSPNSAMFGSSDTTPMDNYFQVDDLSEVSLSNNLFDKNNLRILGTSIPAYLTGSSSPCMGIFERKMKEFRARQRAQALSMQSKPLQVRPTCITIPYPIPIPIPKVSGTTSALVTLPTLAPSSPTFSPCPTPSPEISDTPFSGPSEAPNPPSICDPSARGPLNKPEMQVEVARVPQCQPNYQNPCKTVCVPSGAEPCSYPYTPPCQPLTHCLDLPSDSNNKQSSPSKNGCESANPLDPCKVICPCSDPHMTTNSHPSEEPVLNPTPTTENPDASFSPIPDEVVYKEEKVQPTGSPVTTTELNPEVATEPTYADIMRTVLPLDQKKECRRLNANCERIRKKRRAKRHLKGCSCDCTKMPRACLPHIKRGQDDMLKFLIGVLQGMLNKSCNSKRPYSLGKARSKMCIRIPSSCTGFEPETIITYEANSSSTTYTNGRPPCSPNFNCFPFPLPCPASAPIPCQPMPCQPLFPVQVNPPPTTPKPLEIGPFSELCVPSTATPSTTESPVNVGDLVDFTVVQSYTSFTKPAKIPNWSRNSDSFKWDEKETSPSTTRADLLPPAPPKPYNTEVSFPSIYFETIQPWPTKRPFPQTTPLCSPYRKIFNIPINVLEPSGEKNIDYADENMPIELSDAIMYDDGLGGKVNRFEYETMYEIPEDSVEQAEIDLRNRNTDYPCRERGHRRYYPRIVYRKPGKIPSLRENLQGDRFDDEIDYYYDYPAWYMRMRAREGNLRRNYLLDRVYPRRTRNRHRRRNLERSTSPRHKRDDLPVSEIGVTVAYPPTAEFTSAKIEVKASSKREETSTASSSVEETVAPQTTVSTEKQNESASNEERLLEWDSFAHENRQELQRPSTLRSAALARGPKKVLIHPPARTYAKVFPESLSEGPEETSPAPRFTPEKPTPATPINNLSMMHLQLLAVCEGYLEMIKLLKANNQTYEMDNELIRYCENEISKSFGSEDEETRTESMVPSTTPEDVTSPELSKRNLRNKIVVDILGSQVYKDEVRAHSQLKNAVNERKPMKRRKRFRKKRRKSHTTEPMLDSRELLRKNSLASLEKDAETELMNEDFYDDGGAGDTTLTTPETEPSQTSVRPTKMEDKGNLSPETTTLVETTYPVYARRYNYDKPGKITNVEIQVRGLNKKNKTQTVSKNITVFALDDQETVTDSRGPDVLVGPLTNRVAILSSLPKFNFKPKKKWDCNSTLQMPNQYYCQNPVNQLMPVIENGTYIAQNEYSNNAAQEKMIPGVTAFASKKYNSLKKAYFNAIASAKEKFQDYTIVIINYAVYIIPIAVILLFLFCCATMIFKLMSLNLKRKRLRKKRNLMSSSDEAADNFRDRGRRVWMAVKSKRKQDLEDDMDEHHLKNLERKFSKFLKKQKKRKGSDLEDEVSGSERKRFMYKSHGKSSDNRYSKSLVNEERMERLRQSFARERKELIALLEELRGLEEQIKHKSIIVEYMTPETLRTEDQRVEKSDLSSVTKPCDAICDCSKCRMESLGLYDTSQIVGKQELGQWDGARVQNESSKGRFENATLDMCKELAEGTEEDVANKFDMLSIILDKCSPDKKSVVLEELENLRKKLTKKKYVPLKDDGVLCKM